MKILSLCHHQGKRYKIRARAGTEKYSDLDQSEMLRKGDIQVGQ
jgi:hypothetical protein